MAGSGASGILFAALVLAGAADGAEPTLTHLYPVSGQTGTTTTITATGKFEPWPPQVWVDAEGIQFTPGEKAGKFDVAVAPNAAPGPHLLRLFNQEGASAPRLFIVTRAPELRDTEPNDDFKLPQNVPHLPVTLNGRLDKGGDVDSFAVTLRRGETLVTSVEAYVLGSAFDGLIRIIERGGTQVAFNHDGRTPDPFLAWTAPRDGIYVVQILGFAHPATSDVRLTGGDGCVYRMHFTAQPFLGHSLPLAVQRGHKKVMDLVGWNLPLTQLEWDGERFTNHGESSSDDLFLPDPPILITDVPELMETEPNDLRSAAEALPIPGGITGRIDRATDEDRYLFSAVKERSYDFKVMAARLGSPLDVWLKIEDSEGKELARNDDAAGSSDAQLTWTAPADGSYIAALGEVTHRGGAEFVYRLAASEAVPTVTGTVANHSLVLQLANTSEIKVTVKAVNGFAAKLKLAAKNLPTGVTAPEVEVPEKGGDVTVRLSAEAEAPRTSQSFQLVLREVETGHEHPVRYPLASTSEDNGVPQGYTTLLINSTAQLWLTVSAEAARKEPPKE